MAKAGFWLKGARGKLADSVLTKGEKATIIREKVTPRNAQTEAQMLRRVAFATAGNAAKFMFPIIGQTFQGMANVKMNRRAFIRENARMLARDTSQNSYNPKGVSQLIPNNYIISKGMLKLPECFTPHIETNWEDVRSFIFQTIPFQDQYLEVGDTISWDKLFARHFMTRLNGKQLTICAILLNGDNNMAYDAELPDLVRYTKFVASRIVFKNGNLEGSLTITEDDTEASVIQKVKDVFFNQFIDTRLSDPDLVNILYDSGMKVDYDADTQLYTLGSKQDFFQWIYEDEYIFDGNAQSLASIGCVLSEFGSRKWAYSNSRMVTNPIEGLPLPTNGGYWGYTFEHAVSTYIKAGDVTSALFTRRGGDDNTVG